jgi:hypothetical protein
MSDGPVLELLPGDVLRLRRSHPCGGTDWTVDRIGADIGLVCQGCGRRVLIGRRQLERRIAGFVRRGERATENALQAAPDGGRDA